MKTLVILLFSIFFLTPCFSQKDLLPVYPNEITYQNNRAYFNGSPFTGLLVVKKTNKKIGEFKNGYKNGMFTEYYTNGKKKSTGNFVNGQKDGVHFEWYENGILTSEFNYEYGKIINGEYTIYNIDNTPYFVRKYESNKIIKESYSSGKFILYDNNGNKIGEGKVIDGKEHYNGKEHYADYYYEGEWVDNKWEGYGSIYYSNANQKYLKFNGSFHNGKKNGTGVLMWKNGTQEIGEWVNDEKTGEWVIDMAPWGNTVSSIYRGTLKNDQLFNGFIISKTKDGYVFRTEIRNGAQGEHLLIK
ncbi:MAG: hypothetical protein Q8S41_09880 [Lutibacter sp.]|nr:hypothetical protein [Lutibacter sp.]